MQNYFELFDLPVSFDIDLELLADRFRELQQRLHPDKFVTSSEQERRLSIQHASRVNDAYQALRNPLKRAQYLLEHYGYSAEQNASTMDNAFLMEQIELREELAEIPAQGNPETALDAYLNKVDVFEKELVLNIKLQLDNVEEDSLRSGLLGKVNEEVKKLQFIYKLKEEAIELEETLG